MAEAKSRGRDQDELVRSIQSFVFDGEKSRVPFLLESIPKASFLSSLPRLYDTLPRPSEYSEKDARVAALSFSAKGAGDRNLEKCLANDLGGKDFNPFIEAITKYFPIEDILIWLDKNVLSEFRFLNFEDPETPPKTAAVEFVLDRSEEEIKKSIKKVKKSGGFSVCLGSFKEGEFRAIPTIFYLFFPKASY